VGAAGGLISFISHTTKPAPAPYSGLGGVEGARDSGARSVDSRHGPFYAPSGRPPTCPTGPSTCTPDHRRHPGRRAAHEGDHGRQQRRFEALLAMPQHPYGASSRAPRDTKHYGRKCA
jgi:hypothetical protein